MSKLVDYCVVEFDFLSGGANHTFMTLTSAQRFAYICAWNYATHLRRLHLSRYEMKHRLAAIYDIDRRTVEKMLHICCKDADLLVEEKDGYTITGIAVKHSKLGSWKTGKAPVKSDLPGDSTVQDSTVQDNIKGKGKETEKIPRQEIEEFWNALCRKSGLVAIQIWSDERKRYLKARWKHEWFRISWQDIFRIAHRNDWCKENRADIVHVLRPKNALRYYESLPKNRPSRKSSGFDITVRYSDNRPPVEIHMRNDAELAETIDRIGIVKIEGQAREYYLDVEKWKERVNSAKI